MIYAEVDLGYTEPVLIKRETMEDIKRDFSKYEYKILFGGE